MLGTNPASSPRTTQMKVDSLLHAGNNLDKARKLFADAIKHRGSSLADEQYRDLFGEIGEYQGSHQVYDREGQPCRRCRNNIVRVKTGGRSTFFCEHCQV